MWCESNPERYISYKQLPILNLWQKSRKHVLKQFVSSVCVCGCCVAFLPYDRFYSYYAFVRLCQFRMIFSVQQMLKFPLFVFSTRLSVWLIMCMRGCVFVYRYFSRFVWIERNNIRDACICMVFYIIIIILLLCFYLFLAPSQYRDGSVVLCSVRLFFPCAWGIMHVLQWHGHILTGIRMRWWCFSLWHVRMKMNRARHIVRCGTIQYSFQFISDPIKFN